jgi:UDP-glucose 4-epimerase
VILVTGGLGFVGQHTVRSLVEMGQGCVLVQRRPPAPPADLADVSSSVVLERADVGDYAALDAIACRHAINAIVHLAGSVPWPPSSDAPVVAARDALGGLFNILQLAHQHGIRRVSAASTIGVYGGLAADRPLTEDLPLPMVSNHPIPAFKKIGELIADYASNTTEVEVISLRLSPWGPGSNPRSTFTAVPQLVRAAALGVAPDYSSMRVQPYANDGLDSCYAPDCGRAIALLTLAPRLRHRTYNIGRGDVLTNDEVIQALNSLIPTARLSLPLRPAGAAGPEPVRLDISRLRSDTGFEPSYSTGQAVANYVDWLRAGHQR